MNKNFLDYTGLGRYTGKLEAFILGKITNLVPDTRTINGQPLSSDIELTAEDVGAPFYTGGLGVDIKENVVNLLNPNRGIVSQDEFNNLSMEEQNKGTYFISSEDSSEDVIDPVDPEPDLEPKVHIYGVEWDGTATTKWTRTDDAALFTDPNPAVNNGTGSSPFDNLYPWKDMTVEERTGGTMVKEPKYWYKWTKTGKTMKLQIADGPVEGFHVDPVNMDRGDGLGELDFSYIGRYHCADGTYKSETNKAQQVSITRSTARDVIHSLGPNYWQMDFAQMWYVNMLYLVEFADWDGQATIGYGCSESGLKENNGTTDVMEYHTGTTVATRDTYGFTQYRNIEGWWDNCFDWMDGCYYNANGLNVISNPSQFSDSENGILVGLPSNGYSSEFTVPTISDLEWALFPSANVGNKITYTTDSWGFVDSFPCLYHGGSYNKNLSCGLFYISTGEVLSISSDTSCRLQERPPKTT